MDWRRSPVSRISCVEVGAQLIFMIAASSFCSCCDSVVECESSLELSSWRRFTCALRFI